MGDVSLGIKLEKPPLEDIEAANILLLLWERTVARNNQMQTYAPFITNNAPQAAAHASFLQNYRIQQHTVPFQQPAPDFPGLPLPSHYYYSAVPPQACMLPQPMFTYYGLMASTPSCYVGPVRLGDKSAPLTKSPQSPPPPPSVAFEDDHKSTLSELDDDRQRPSGEQNLETDANRKMRRPRGSSEKPEAKRRRKNLTKEQVRVLEEAYATSKYPQAEDRVKLQGPTKLSEARIQVWFQNRRAKERREVEWAAVDRAEEHSGENNVLSSYTTEQRTGNKETFAQ